MSRHREDQPHDAARPKQPNTTSRAKGCLWHPRHGAPTRAVPKARQGRIQARKWGLPLFPPQGPSSRLRASWRVYRGQLLSWACATKGGGLGKGLDESHWAGETTTRPRCLARGRLAEFASAPNCTIYPKFLAFYAPQLTATNSPANSKDGKKEMKTARHCGQASRRGSTSNGLASTLVHGPVGDELLALRRTVAVH